jgi:hypothetical protein
MCSIYSNTINNYRTVEYPHIFDKYGMQLKQLKIYLDSGKKYNLITVKKGVVQEKHISGIYFHLQQY